MLTKFDQEESLDGEIFLTNVCLVNIFDPECYKSIWDYEQVKLEKEFPLLGAVVFGIPAQSFP